MEEIGDSYRAGLSKHFQAILHIALSYILLINKKQSLTSKRPGKWLRLAPC
jgi:hypothetical protein